MAKPDHHGGAQERSSQGDTTEESLESCSSKRRRVSVVSDELHDPEHLGYGGDSSEEKQEGEEDDDYGDNNDDDDDDDDDDNDDDDDGDDDDVDGPDPQRKHLKSFKHFVQELGDDVLPDEAVRRYSLYVGSQKYEKQSYFEAHETAEWLRNKYHPSNLMAMIERRKQRARASATQFCHDLENQISRKELYRDFGLTFSSSETSEDKSDAERSLKTRRLLLNVAQTQALALKLDTEKGVDNNILWPENSNTHPAVAEQDTSELLDNLVKYLWHVHGVVYYGMREYEEDVEFTGYPENCEPNYEEDGWEEKLRSFWQLRLNGGDPLERRAAIKDIEAAVDKALDRYVVKVEDENMGFVCGCGAKHCLRPFGSIESVREHLRTRHPELVTPLKEQLEGEFYFGNYMRDPDAPVGLRNDEDVQPLPKNNDHCEAKTDEIEVNTAATSGNLNQYIQEISGTAATSENPNLNIQAIRGEDNTWKYRCQFEGCTKVLDAHLPVLDHILEDHRNLVLGLPFELNQDDYPQDNSNNAVAPAEGGSPNHSAS